LYDYLVRKSEEARKTVEDEVQVLVRSTLKKMNVPTQEDLKKLEDRIKKLEPVKKAPAKAKPAPKVVKKAKAAPKK
jgi:hypothetical protein